MASEPPAPPYSSGTSMPIRPGPKNSLTSAGSSLASRSICCTSGRTYPSANPATASRKSTSSSERRGRGRGAAASVIIDRARSAFARHRPRDDQAGALGDDLGELLMDTERVGHAESHAGKRGGGFADHAWDVARGVLPRREHVGEGNHLGRAGLDAGREALRDRRLGQL